MCFTSVVPSGELFWRKFYTQCTAIIMIIRPAYHNYSHDIWYGYHIICYTAPLIRILAPQCTTSRNTRYNETRNTIKTYRVLTYAISDFPIKTIHVLWNEVSVHCRTTFAATLTFDVTWRHRSRDHWTILGCDAHLEWIFAEIYWRVEIDQDNVPAYEIKLMLSRVLWALAQISFLSVITRLMNRCT